MRSWARHHSAAPSFSLCVACARSPVTLALRANLLLYGRVRMSGNGGTAIAPRAALAGARRPARLLAAPRGAWLTMVAFCRVDLPLFFSAEDHAFRFL